MGWIEWSYIDTRASDALEDMILSDVRLSKEDKKYLLIILEQRIWETRELYSVCEEDEVS